MSILRSAAQHVLWLHVKGAVTLIDGHQGNNQAAQAMQGPQPNRDMRIAGFWIALGTRIPHSHQTSGREK
jgi:hypothetical protein